MVDRNLSSSFQNMFARTFRSNLLLVCCFTLLVGHAEHVESLDAVNVQQYPGFKVARGVSLNAIQNFDSTVKSIVRSLSLGWSETAIYSQLAAGFLVASQPFPSIDSFEKFTGGDIYFNPRQIIQGMEWVPRVPNDEREMYEARMRNVTPGFDIFLFSSNPAATNGRLIMPRNSSIEYHPITYVTPASDRNILGFDLYNDEIEGPFIRRIRSTGQSASSVPFLLRSVSQTPFKMGMTIYMPLFAKNKSMTSLTLLKTPYYSGCVVTVIIFRPLLLSVLQRLNLEQMDVFVFAIDEKNHPTYVGHVESEPFSTSPGLQPDQVANLQPEDITGDIVTTFDDVYDFTIVEQRFRVVVRARKGYLAREVVVFNSSSSAINYVPCGKMSQCAEVEQGSPLTLTVEDAQRRAISWKEIGAANATLCLPKGSLQCNISILESSQGLHIFEIFAGSEQASVFADLFSQSTCISDFQIPQISSSPLLISVSSRQCKGGFQVSEIDGHCMCPRSSIVFGDTCLDLATFIASLFVFLALLGGAMGCIRGLRADKEHTQICQEMARLRVLLRITRKHGYVLSSDWFSSWSSIWLNRDIVIVQRKYLESAARLSLFREDFEVKFFDSFCVCLSDKQAQYQILRLWLLEICQFLLDPTDGEGKDLPTVRTRMSISLRGLRQGFRGSKIHNVFLPFGEQLDHEAWTPQRRFQYFRNKISKLRIWQDDDNSLLRELKDVAQGLMNKIATLYDQRYEQFCVEPDGIRISTMSLDIIPVSQVLGCVVNRQDHDEVMAIRVDNISRREAEVQSQFPHCGALQDEDLFLSQLSLRARLLNESFRQKVVQVIKKHKVGARASDPSVMKTRRGSLQAEDNLQNVVMTECQFEEGIAVVEVHTAPIKTITRMREKLLEYNIPDGIWPLSANILDPVRVSLVCQGPSQILQVLSWFQNFEKETGLPVIRIKNKFSLKGDVQQGYRDLKLFVMHTDISQLRIIGEIQIHDRAFFDNKHKTHRLYTIARAQYLNVL